ncbi:MAG: DUF6273 domain-containing protein, partial [Eubacteriales bacterium]|nr:DUF6273 domain-containing protein [Eubacteriales bacterium]
MKKVYQGFVELQQAISDKGLCAIDVGDAVLTKHDKLGELTWDVIGPEPGTDGVAVMMRNPPLWRCFDEPSKEYPLGYNAWETAAIRAWLNSCDFIDGFSSGDAEAITAVVKRTYSTKRKQIVETTDRLFLLSASEAGYAVDSEWVMDEGPAYPYFAE